MPTLYDAQGRKVDVSALRKEKAAPSISGTRKVNRTSVATGLDPARLAGLLRSADNGDHDAYLTLAEEMEEREWHYRSVLSTRKLAITGAPVEVEAASDESSDQELAEEVRGLVEDPIFEGLLLDLLDGLGKGFSVVEILWDTDARTASGRRIWKPRAYRHRPQRFFRFDRETLSVLRLRTDDAPTEGEELDAWKYVAHVPRLTSGVPIRAGLARIAAAAYLLKSFSIRDWWGFMEVYGLPFRLGRYPSGATEKEKDELLDALAALATDAAGIIPDGMQVELVEAARSGGGDKLFSGAAEYIDKQVSKIVLGQTMTSDDGASLAQSKTHEKVRIDIAQADARAVSATVNRDLVRAFIDLNWGPQTAYPRVKVQIEEPEDLQAFSGALAPMIDRGLRVPQRFVRDKLGVPDPEDEDELMGSAAPPRDGESEPAPDEESDPEEAGDEERDRRDDTTAKLNRLIAFEVERALNRARPRQEDELDALWKEHLEEWQPLLEPVVQPLFDAVNQSSSFEDARSRLEETLPGAEQDLARVALDLAAALLKARGLGDATDQVD